MEIFFGVVCVIIFLLFALGPLLRRFLAPILSKWAMGKWEDNMRRMAGMPTRKEEKKAAKRAKKQQAAAAENYRRRPHSTIKLLRIVAEDVEFTEIKDFSPEIEIGGKEKESNRRKRVKEEFQIEDADFVEIKQK